MANHPGDERRQLRSARHDARDGAAVPAVARRSFSLEFIAAGEVPTDSELPLVPLDSLPALASRLRAIAAGVLEYRRFEPLVGRFEELAVEAAAIPNRCEVVADAGRMPSHFEWADLAVSGAGSTCWELAYSGVPFVTIALAENQRLIAESLEDAGVSRHAGWYADLDEGALADTIGDLADDRDARSRMASAGRALVDGYGAERTAGRLARAAAA